MPRAPHHRDDGGDDDADAGIDTRLTLDGTAHAEIVDADLADPLLGVLVADRYRVVSRLGEGGIGRVYRALHEQLGRWVALKILHPELSDRRELQQRFEREARAASRLNHPGSVMVYDFGAWQDMLYLAMELVLGRSLSEVVHEESPLSVARIVDLGAQVCDALETAHAQGLLHRDLKPENVLVTHNSEGREVTKLCDYGLAWATDETTKGPRLTREGTVAGTPAFMAPEQVMNRELDGRTDVYALGAVLYEMVCGRPPFEGAGPMEILTKQLYDEPEPPSRRAIAPIPKDLEALILKALQKSPAQRPQTAAEMKAALLAVMAPSSRRTDRPSGEEVQVLFDREARAEAAGISPVKARASSDQTPAAIKVMVIAPAEVPFDRSAVAILRANGAFVVATEAFGAPAETMVLDVRGDAATGMQALADARAQGLVGPVLLVVGPDDDFAIMARALELQAAEYVPESLLATLPRKLHRALGRVRKHKN